MCKVEISEQLYKEVAEAARVQRISVEQFVAEAVKVYMEEEPETPNLDHLFTPEVMAAIDKGAQQAREGKSYTLEEVDQHFEHLTKLWEQKQG
jgi:hypothetical protein